MTASPTLRPVLAWRLVAGGLLHFAVLGDLLLVPLACLLLAPAHASAETVARLVLRVSLLFLGGLAALASAALPAALLFGRGSSMRRWAGSPEARSAAEVAAVARTALDEALAAPVARIAAQRWDHANPRCQALARDLGEVVRATAAALASAPDDRRATITAKAAAALNRIEEELARLVAIRAYADEQQVELLSNYVGVRYLGLDSPLKPD